MFAFLWGMISPYQLYISVNLLRVDWKKKKHISRLPTAERRGWALVHSSFVAPLGCFTPKLVERSKIGKTDGNQKTWYLGLGRYVTSGIKLSLCNFLDFRDVGRRFGSYQGLRIITRKKIFSSEFRLPRCHEQHCREVFVHVFKKLVFLFKFFTSLIFPYQNEM